METFLTSEGGVEYVPVNDGAALFDRHFPMIQTFLRMTSANSVSALDKKKHT